MNTSASALSPDTPSVSWAPWLTPRRAILFVVAWLTLFALASFLVSDPFQAEPNAGTAPTVGTIMFEHGLLIGMVGLMALLALSVMRIRSIHVRAWIVVGVVAATVLAQIGGIFDTQIPGSEVPMWTQIIGFFALDEILIVLIWGLWSERQQARDLGRLPLVAGILAALSMLAAAVMGHLAGWIMEFGAWPTFVGDYSSAAGFKKIDDLEGALVGSHSHEMAVSAMALVLVVTVVHFGYARLGGAARLLARIGVGLLGAGTLLVGLFYIATGITTWAPPDAIAKFGSDPNVIPLDDVLSGALVMGGGVVALLAFLPSLVRSPVRAAAGWTYVLTAATVAVAGYTIELNTSYFGAGDPKAAGAANDAIFTWLHQDIGLFLLPTMLAVMLAAEIFVAAGAHRDWIGGLTITGTTILYAGGMYWVFADPALFGPGYWLSTVGVVITGLAALATIWYLGIAAFARPHEAPKPGLQAVA